MNGRHMCALLGDRLLCAMRTYLLHQACLNWRAGASPCTFRCLFTIAVRYRSTRVSCTTYDHLCRAVSHVPYWCHSTNTASSAGRLEPILHQLKPFQRNRTSISFSVDLSSARTRQLSRDTIDYRSQRSPLHSIIPLGLQRQCYSHLLWPLSSCHGDVYRLYRWRKSRHSVDHRPDTQAQLWRCLLQRHAVTAAA